MDGVKTLIQMEKAVAILNEDCVIRVYNLLTGKGFTKPEKADRGNLVPEVTLKNLEEFADDPVLEGKVLSKEQLGFITPFARACGAFVDKQAKENPNDQGAEGAKGAEWVVCSELAIFFDSNSKGRSVTGISTTARGDASFPLANRKYVATQALKLWSRFLEVLWELTQASGVPTFEFGEPTDPYIFKGAQDPGGVGWRDVHFTENLHKAVLDFLDIQYLYTTRDRQNKADFAFDNPPALGKRMRLVNDYNHWSRVLQEDTVSDRRPLGDTNRDETLYNLRGTWGAGGSGDVIIKSHIDEEIGVQIEKSKDFKMLVNNLQRIDTQSNKLSLSRYTHPGSVNFPSGTVIGGVYLDGSKMPDYYYLDTLIWPELLAPIQSEYRKMHNPSKGPDPTSVALNRIITDDIAREIGLGTRKVTSTYMYGNVKYVRKDGPLGVPGDVPAQEVHNLLRKWGAVGRIIYQLHEAQNDPNINMDDFEVDEDDVKILGADEEAFEALANNAPSSLYKTIGMAIPLLEEEDDWGAWE